MNDLQRERAPDREHIALLRSRAAELAHLAARERGGASTPSVLFVLGGELYALDARIVHEVAVLRELTPLPGARAPLFGVTHWRGDVLTILDLRAELGVVPRGVTDLSRVVVVDGGSAPFGILADAARDFVQIEEEQVRPLPSEEMAQRRLVRGITDDAVLVIDAAALLSRHGSAARRNVSNG